MRVFITGGTGFVGKPLSNMLVEIGHKVTILTRGHKPSTDGITYISGISTQPGTWQDELAKHDAVINLAGRSIFCPWTKKNKESIRKSRLETTRNVADVLAGSSDKILLNASAVGYYGNGFNKDLTESSSSGNDFLANLARDWEESAMAAGNARVILCRFGVILHRDGGALQKMLLPFRLGLGSPLGNGCQYIPWIHLTDLCRAIIFCLEQSTISGPVNCTAPYPVVNGDFSRLLAETLNRPYFLPPLPAFLLHLVLGEMAKVVLFGQKALPSKLQKENFHFLYPEVAGALADLV